MKTLHVAALLKPPSGILNQMTWELESAQNLKLKWDVKLFCPKGAVAQKDLICESTKIRSKSNHSALNWLRFRYEYYCWLLKQEAYYDRFVLRYYVHDPFQLLFIIRCKKPVYFVHHSFEVAELNLPGTFFAKIRANLECLLGRFAIKRASGIIAVTNEIAEYEKTRANLKDVPTFIYPNGISFQHGPVQDKRGEVPELLFVAHEFVPWHGLDLLLDSIEKTNVNFKLHLVGSVSRIDIIRARRDNRIVIHGQKNTKEIRELAQYCSVGLTSFGLHRKKMSEACTLKVREYLLMGLPVYGGHRDVIQNQNIFIKSGPPSIDSILDYVRTVSFTRKVVSEGSEASICKKSLLLDLYNKL